MKYFLKIAKFVVNQKGKELPVLRRNNGRIA